MKKEKIKRFGWFMTGFLLMMGTHVMAGSGWKANLKSAAVFDHYHEVVYVEPYTIEVCEQQQVANPDDLINSAFWGAIFGAVVGDAIDEDSGKVPGAIIGAALGAEEAKKNSTTTAMVCKQETRQQRTVRNVYSHSTIEFDYEGSYYEVNFTKR